VLIFSEIRADHTVDGLKVEFKPRPIWEPYLEAVLARQRQEQTPSTPALSGRRDSNPRQVPDAWRRWLRTVASWSARHDTEAQRGGGRVMSRKTRASDEHTRRGHNSKAGLALAALGDGGGRVAAGSRPDAAWVRGAYRAAARRQDRPRRARAPGELSQHVSQVGSLTTMRWSRHSVRIVRTQAAWKAPHPIGRSLLFQQEFQGCHDRQRDYEVEIARRGEFEEDTSTLGPRRWAL
jgi:hypothetical protein